MTKTTEEVEKIEKVIEAREENTERFAEEVFLIGLIPVTFAVVLTIIGLIIFAFVA